MHPKVRIGYVFSRHENQLDTNPLTCLVRRIDQHRKHTSYESSPLHYHPSVTFRPGKTRKLVYMTPERAPRV